MNRIRVLLVDDEEDFTAGLSKVIRRRGFNVAVAKDADSALLLIWAEQLDVILQDVRIPGKDGTHFRTNPGWSLGPRL
jgi:DNA-binding response OmpR family regulator